MKEITSTLVHHVFFWFKEPENNSIRTKFIEAINELRKIENINKSHFGQPASTELRTVVDHSYTFSLMLFFNSKNDQDIYQIHPTHLKFVEENKHLWEKVIVYDAVDLLN